MQRSNVLNTQNATGTNSFCMAIVPRVTQTEDDKLYCDPQFSVCVCRGEGEHINSQLERTYCTEWHTCSVSGLSCFLSRATFIQSIRRLRVSFQATGSVLSWGTVTVLVNIIKCQSQWPCGLRRRSTAARLLRSWVRIPPRAWCCECYVLSGRGLCDGLIIRSE